MSRERVAGEGCVHARLERIHEIPERGSQQGRASRFLSKAAAAHGCTLTQFALQFVNQLQGVSVALIGVSSLKQLDRLLSTDFPLSTLGVHSSSSVNT